MKRKAISFTMLALLAVSIIVPTVAKAYESWDYGYDQANTRWYNYYYHSDYNHYGSITKNGVTYFGPLAGPGNWSNLRLELNGPYAATYNKHIEL